MANALIDSGTGGTFINYQYVIKNRITSRRLPKSFHLRTVDGSRNLVTHYCILRVKVDQRILTGKFNITSLGKDDIILGLPFLQKIKPTIDWAKGTLSLPALTSPTTRQTDQPLPDLDNPLSDIWSQRADLTPSEIVKISNKAQEFALKEQQKAAAKTPEELVPPYLHDFLNSVFSEEKAKELPPTRPGFDHKIDLLPTFSPKKSEIYHLSPLEEAAMKEFVKENLDKGFIETSKSPQASGFFFVGKKDGKLRPCQDYRRLNTHTVKNAYPLPLIPPLLNKLRSAKYFTKVDIRAGYNNIQIAPEDRWKAAFITNEGLFQPTVMFFGLCNSPPTFQAFMNHVFRMEIEEGWLIIYMDDILIFSQDLNDHQKRTRRILELLKKEHLFLKPAKCYFDVTEIEFLGMIIRHQEIAMDSAKIKGITEWGTPQNLTDVRSFLGFCNFYRQFISHFSDLARPLIDLTKKAVAFAWGPLQEKAFQSLKKSFTASPVLKNPDPQKQFAIATDASLVATGGILLQKDDNGAYHPCAYISDAFSPAERNYQIYDRELLAII